MYKCKICKYQSQPGETLFKIYRYKKLQKGIDIEGETGVCYKCYKRHKGDRNEK